MVVLVVFMVNHNFMMTLSNKAKYVTHFWGSLYTTIFHFLIDLTTELEAKLDNSNDERRMLVERCIASEGECVKLKEKVTELGRENQSLQVSLANVIQFKEVAPK